MEVNRINNTSFKGISMPKKVVLMPIGMEYPVISTKQDFLNNPAIKECAEKYDILIKRGKKIGKRDCTNEERLKMTLAGGSILATGAITVLYSPVSIMDGRYNGQCVRCYIRWYTGLVH